MGAKDTKSKEYLSDNKRFADVCNYALYNGQKVIQADDLIEQDSMEVLSILGINEKEIHQQRWRDLLKRAVIKMFDNTIYVLLGIENQSEIHYAMPVKNMIYDALNYGSQVKEATKLHKYNRDRQSQTEFLSGFMKTDLLTPIVTITLYWGPEKWDGPLSLHEMFGNMDERLRKYIPNYHVNLIEPYAIEDFDKFETELGEVLELIKYSNDKEKFGNLVSSSLTLKELSNESLSAVNLFTKSEIPLNERDEVTDVCRAIEELKQDYAKEKLEIGLAEELVKTVENAMKNFSVSLEDACNGLGYSIEKYKEANQLLDNDSNGADL